MRAFIAAIVALAFGAVLGAVVIRTQLNPKLMEMAEVNAQLEQDKKRLTDELAFASERMQWVEKENAELRSQIQTSAAMPTAVVSGEEAGKEPTEPDGGSTLTPDESAGGTSSSYIPSDPADASKPNSVEDQKLATPEQQMAYMERQMLDNVLVEDMDASTDPTEKARLQNVIEHRKLVRDLYRDLRDAATPEERQVVLDTILKARSNLKVLVKSQQDEMLRKTIESADSSNEQGRSHLVDKLQEIQKSPYFTDPLFIWGMAAPDQADVSQ